MIEINRSRFLQALALARDVVKSKASLPVLSCIKLTDESGGLQLVATDLDSELTILLPVEKTGKFSAVVSVVKLSCFLSVCDGEFVQLEVRKKFLDVKCGDASCSLLCVEESDFPASPDQDKMADSEEFSPSELLEELATVFCASTDASRYALCSLFFCRDAGKSLNVVATDGRRLAMREINSPGATLAAMVPTSAVKLMQAVLRSKLVEGSVDLGFSGVRVFLMAGTVQFSGKLIEGNYPNWRQVVPPDAAGIPFSPSRLIGAVERAAALAQDSVTIEMKGQLVRVLGTASEVGTSEDKFELELGGASSVVKVNPDFLLQGLKWCGSRDAVICPGDGMEPIVIKPGGAAAARYVVMPLRPAE